VSKPRVGRRRPFAWAIAELGPTAASRLATSDIRCRHQLAYAPVPETSKTADHALAVLLELSEHGPLTTIELARRLNLNRTVVYRLVATLRDRGFLIRNDHGYLPGAIFLRIAERVKPELRAAAADSMRRLSEQLGETTVLHVADGDDAVVLAQHVGAAHVLRVAHAIGSRHSLSSGASGRALLAFMSPATVARAVRNAADPAGVEDQLAYVRRLGYATSHDELQNGVHGLAAPVLGSDGWAIASLAIIVPIGRAIVLPEAHLALASAASEVAAALGVVGDVDPDAVPWHAGSEILAAEAQ
jgi:IclR family transcriptional regulator, KDG regulon repressor